MSTDREAGAEAPKKRGAKSQYAEEMFERVRARVAEGMPVPTAIQAAGMCVSQFYAAVAEHPEWKVALQKARQERRVERLEDESCRRVFIGDSRPVFWKGERVGEIREPAIGMLIFMMKTLSPERYANTKAAAKRRAQLDGLEASRARVLVNAQRGVKIMQGHYRAYLQRCGVPVPPGDSEQSAVNSDRSSVPPDTAAGQKGNLTHDLDLNHNHVPSGPASASPACGTPPCTKSTSGGEDTAGMGGREPSAVNGDQLSANSDPSSGENPEAGQCRDYDPDYDSEPKLPPPYEPWWRPGMDVTVTMLEDEAYRLAIEGVVKPIFQQGTEVGERRVRSERLLQFLLIASAFKKYGRREVGPLQAEEEPGRPEFMAKLNAIYGQDEELHRKFTEVFERNNARRHAERLAELQRQNRGSKAPPCTHGASGAEDTTGTGQRGSDQLSVISNQSSKEDTECKAPPCTHGASGAEDTTGTGQRGSDQLSVISNQSSKEDTECKAPPCTHGAFGAEDTTGTGQRGSDQLSVISNQSSKEDTECKAPPCTHGASGAEDTEGTGQGGSDPSSGNSEWDVLDFDQFSAAVAASRSPAPSGTAPVTPGETPEYPESGGQSHAQIAGNETIARQENPAAGPRSRKQSSGEDTDGTGGSKQSSVNCDQSSVAARSGDDAAGQRENLDQSGPGGAPRPGPAANEAPAGRAENQASEPEHDAAWYSPSARAARITQSMIEHRLRRRRVEM